MNYRPDDKRALIQPLDIGGDGPHVVVKDNFDVAGTVTTCGSEALSKSGPVKANCAAVQALIDAGCRIVGKANMHELAYGMTGINEFYGTPVNPKWPDRIPGGSSSGSAVAVANGSCDFALGTDTGGSVRQPAACCGIYGLKPTFGRINHTGILPAQSSLDCVGVFANSIDMIEDAMLALDPKFARAHDPNRPRLAFIEETLDSETGPAIQDHLKHEIPMVHLASLSLLASAFAAGMTIISSEMASSFGYLVTSNAPLGKDVRDRLQASLSVTQAEVENAEECRVAFSEEVDTVLESNDALITPSLPSIPPTLDEARNPRNIASLTRFLRPFNVSGHPAISLPMNGTYSLPIAMQLIGRKGQDAQLLQTAKWLVSNVSCLRQSQSKVK